MIAQLVAKAELLVQKCSMLLVPIVVVLLSPALLWHMVPRVELGLVAIRVSRLVMAAGAPVANGIQTMPVLLVALALSPEALSVVGVAMANAVAVLTDLPALEKAIAIGMATALVRASASAILLAVVPMDVLVGVFALSVNPALVGTDVVVSLVPSANPGACPSVMFVLLDMVGHSMPHPRVPDPLMPKAMAVLLAALLEQAMIMAVAPAALHVPVLGAQAIVLAVVLMVMLLIVAPSVQDPMLAGAVVVLLPANPIAVAVPALIPVSIVLQEVAHRVARDLMGVILRQAMIGEVHRLGVVVLSVVAVVT